MKNEDNPRTEDDPKNEDNPKNEDDPKNENDLKKEDFLKMQRTLKMEEIKDTDKSRLKCFKAKVSHQKIFTDIRGIFSYVFYVGIHLYIEMH